MPIEEHFFTEPIYTRRNKFNHDYDLTLNAITEKTNNKGFSNYGYCCALIECVHSFSRHERLFFLRHQLKAASNPMRWLLDFEKLVEINSWKSAQEFYNLYENLGRETKAIISDLFKAIESGEFKSKTQLVDNGKNSNDIFYNTEEACSFLNISKSTIYKMTSSKGIPFYKPNGKNMYFKKSELEVFLLNKKQISNSEIETQVSTYLTRNHKL